MTTLYKAGLAACGLGLVLTIIGLTTGTVSLWQLGIVLAAVCFTIGAGYWPFLKNYQFTLWIIAGFIAAMTYGPKLTHWGNLNIANKWIVIFVIQATMFSMGTKLSIADFIGVAKMPRAVFAGAFAQFTIMPLLGFALTMIFDFPPEIAMGIILIGSCASGLSSNVMCYIANANLALSVSVTALCTILSAIVTPIWVKVLGSSFVNVNFYAMIINVIQIVIVPIGAAILHDYLKNYATKSSKSIFAIISAACALWLAFMIFGGWNMLFGELQGNIRSIAGLTNFFAAGILWAFVYTYLTQIWPIISDLMPAVSMTGIIFFTTTAAANGRDTLVQVGLMLILAMFIHNIGGYIVGYLVSRFLFRLDEQSSRTISIEVGLQNGGMASGLAAAMGKLATVGLAAAVVTPIGNVSGSILANYWRKRKVSTTSNEAQIEV
ncbi:MAG: bile acid:sodium symporter family protein [Alphaproteobacteria bacterium]